MEVKILSWVLLSIIFGLPAAAVTYLIFIFATLHLPDGKINSWIPVIVSAAVGIALVLLIVYGGFV